MSPFSADIPQYYRNEHATRPSACGGARDQHSMAARRSAQGPYRVALEVTVATFLSAKVRVRGG